MKLRVGDRVRWVGDQTSRPHWQEEGKVKSITRSRSNRVMLCVNVEWDEGGTSSVHPADMDRYKKI